ncbi:MAG TPA: Hsp20/alpha crystallin family protein [Candidatus Nitrosotalea sp.]|nr:Hsp20/alpha crystallin family protein [Candidatus Nitrosotalea sp.]
MATNFVPSFKKGSKPVLGNHTRDDFTLRELVPLSFLHERSSKWVLQIDLPGVEKKNISVNITDGHLVIKAKLEEAYTVSNHGHFIKFETFKKVVTIPPHANAKRISAKFKDGILTVTVPRVESGKKIPIG